METDTGDPVQYMTLVPGEAYIPVSVTAVVAFGFVTSSLLINAKPWTTSPRGAWETPKQALSRSNLGGPWLLLLYRLYVALHIGAVAFDLFGRRGFAMLYFYTNWGFVLELVYFVAAALVSASHVRQKPRGPVGAFGVTVVGLFHVSLAVALIVDTLHWGVLWPLLRSLPDPAVVARHRRVTFSWISYNTHILNLAFLLGELALNAIPFHPYLLGFGGLFSSCFGLWAFTFYKRTGRWIYPFLNASKPLSPAFYVAIYLGHWAFFGAVSLLFRAKERALAKRPAAAAPQQQQQQQQQQQRAAPKTAKAE